MAEAKAIFSLEQNEITIQCSPEDKMGDICRKFATETGINLNLFTFLYGENQLNMDLKFKEANQNGMANNEMRIPIFLPAIRTTADYILIFPVLLEGNTVVILSVLIIVALFITCSGGLVDPGLRVIDIIMPAAVEIGRP